MAKEKAQSTDTAKWRFIVAYCRNPVRDVVLEYTIGTRRLDVGAFIKGVPVAIEIQLSSLSMETLRKRTVEYHRRGIYVLWLLQWKPELTDSRYAPSSWEKWSHTLNFGKAYYWIGGLKAVSYQLKPFLRSVPRTSWYSKAGKKMSGGGF